MNPKIIQNTLQQSLAGTTTFPQVVQTLLQEGVCSYHVDLWRGENRYYTAQGESHVETVALTHATAAFQFSASQVQVAIRKVQAGKSNYLQFVSEILAAGCVYYIAYLEGKKVVYLGRNGEEHVEMFPQK